MTAALFGQHQTPSFALSMLFPSFPAASLATNYDEHATRAGVVGLAQLKGGQRGRPRPYCGGERGKVGMPDNPRAASRAGAMARARAYVDDGAFETDLARRVAVKTESQKLPDSLPELHAYLEREMVPAFTGLGFDTQIFANPLPGQGAVLRPSRNADPSLRTVLGYGQGDVILGLEALWTKGAGPWVTARDGDRLYGRGTADNKGQHSLNMAALAAVNAERGGRLGF